MLINFTLRTGGNIIHIAPTVNSAEVASLPSILFMNDPV